MYSMYSQGPRAQPDHPSARGSLRPREQAQGWQARLARLARNHPLFEHRSSLAAIERARGLPRPRVVSLGLGLCAHHAVSRGVPLDVLSMLLCADAARRAIEAEHTLVIIADAHAVRSGLAEVEVLRQARRMEEVVSRVARACDLPMTSMRASVLHAEPDHQAVHRDVCSVAGPQTPPYVSLETADTEALRRRHGSLLKLGWSLGGDARGVRDERFFDARYTRWVGDQAAFAYIKAGRTLSLEKPRTAPYVVLDPETRPLLEPEDDARRKLELAEQRLPHDRYRAAVKHYGQIISAYAACTRPLRGPLPDRLEALRDGLFARHATDSSREAAE